MRGSSIGRALRRPRLSFTRQPSLARRIPHCRRYSTASSAGAKSSADAAWAGALAPFVDELDRIAPSFAMQGDRIRLLETPAEFYQTLKHKISQAERRIFLSTLYIGKEEKDLVTTLQNALRAKSKLKLSILTDALRGTREAPSPSCASLLAPLVAEFGSDRVEIRMYHTPNLTGLRRRLVPRRINEGWGLQHMKLYGFDDEVVVSGANLSADYFTNRQDRYHVFRSADMTEFYARLHGAVAKLSFAVVPHDGPAGFEMVWPGDNAAPSPLDDPRKFVACSTKLLAPLVSPTFHENKDGDSQAGGPRDTKVYVLAQLSQLLHPDTSTERPALSRILSLLSHPNYTSSSWTFTAGYFNPAPSLTKLLLSTASACGTVVTASPHANGFYGSAGVSGLLPSAYTLLARKFLAAAQAHGRAGAVTLKEWRRGSVGEPGRWTYHAKGLWVTLSDEDEGPSVSLVGSSNYTKRSYSLDLEANALVVTQNAALRRGLADEVAWLSRHAETVSSHDLATDERRVGLHVRLAMWLVKVLGGAL